MNALTIAVWYYLTLLCYLLAQTAEFCQVPFTLLTTYYTSNVHSTHQVQWFDAIFGHSWPKTFFWQNFQPQDNR